MPLRVNETQGKVREKDEIMFKNKDKHSGVILKLDLQSRTIGTHKIRHPQTLMTIHVLHIILSCTHILLLPIYVHIIMYTQ
jgi:hypothetical protein